MWSFDRLFTSRAEPPEAERVYHHTDLIDLQGRAFIQRGDFPGYCFVLVPQDPARP